MRKITVDLSDFGRPITWARESRGLSPEDVAKKVRIDVKVYRRIELGQKSVSLIVLARLHRVLGFDANALLRSLPVQVSPASKRVRKGKSSLGRSSGKYDAFGRQLSRVREIKQLTLRSVADAVGFSCTQIASIEAGRKLPSVVLFAKLQRVFNFDANILLENLLDPPT